MKDTLVLVVEDPRGAYEVVLDSGWNILGRGAGARVVLPCSSVSRRHALIRRTHDGFFELIDRCSRNGTLVNGELVDRSILGTGDRIRIGSFEISVRLVTHVGELEYRDHRRAISRRDTLRTSRQAT